MIVSERSSKILQHEKSMIDMYPKVLIIGQTFNRHSGGGVTMSNLFEGWDKDKIAVASNADIQANLDCDVCEKYYQLSYHGKLHPFPISLFMPGVKTGEITCQSMADRDSVAPGPGKSRLSGAYALLRKMLHFTGLYNLIYRLKVTDQFKSWIREYSPDIIYTQLASYELITFVNQLHDELQIPVAIHFMDNWIDNVNETGMLKAFWDKKTEAKLKRLIDNSSVLMSISNSMSEEFEKRYKRRFSAFHNPIDLDKWMPKTELEFKSCNTFTLLYAGRIGKGVSATVRDFADAINKMEIDGCKMIFEIQTPDKDELDRILEYSERVRWVKPVAYNLLPLRMQSADLLVMPYDFDDDSVKFLRYSFPTKVSEYLISGVPVIFYGSSRTAVIRYAMENECGYVINERNVDRIIAALTDLYENPGLRSKFARKAGTLAQEEEDCRKVRAEFRRKLAGQVEIRTAACE